ncbi:hypothetical protein B7494_g1252 [Chlorociboria aeruginascens]|nr:hypothetical protein B7494_g1252 [Chlorociboria aeruginascens]
MSEAILRLLGSKSNTGMSRIGPDDERSGRVLPSEFELESESRSELAADQDSNIIVLFTVSLPHLETQPNITESLVLYRTGAGGRTVNQRSGKAGNGRSSTLTGILISSRAYQGPASSPLRPFAPSVDSFNPSLRSLVDASQAYMRRGVWAALPSSSSLTERGGVSRAQCCGHPLAGRLVDTAPPYLSYFAYTVWCAGAGGAGGAGAGGPKPSTSRDVTID